MNILLIGDPHFKISNAEETSQLHQETIRYVKNNTLDFVVIMGDVLDTHEKIHVQPLCRAVDYITELSKCVKTYVLIGNHDRINNSVFLTEDHPFTGLKKKPNIIIVDKVVENDGFVFVPYVSPGRFLEALKTIDFEPKKQIIFAHQEFRGAKMGAFNSEIGDIWPTDYPCVFSGHIHDFQILQPNLMYTGTPFQHNFGDSSDKFLVKIVCTNGSYKMEKIYLQIKKKRVLIVRSENLQDYVEDPNYTTKLYIEGNTKTINEACRKLDIKNYKIKDNTLKKSIVNDGEKSLNFKDLLIKKVEKLSNFDQKVFQELCKMGK